MSVIIDSESYKKYKKQLDDLWLECKLIDTINSLELTGDNKLIISNNQVIPGVFDFPSYINLNGKSVLKMPNGTYIYDDPLDPNPMLYPYGTIVDYSINNYPYGYKGIVKTSDNKIIFLPHYGYSSLNQKLKLASHFYDKLTDWIIDDFPNVLKYLKLNKNDEVELIKSLDDKVDAGSETDKRKKIKYIKTFIIDEEDICDIIDDFIDEKHIPLYKIQYVTPKFKEYVEEYLIDKLKRKINNN